jgi:hypothetical protein
VTNLNLHTESFVGSTELWRFDTFTRGWERVDKTAANGAAPSARLFHVMTSVGLDLWMHGGSYDRGKGDACVLQYLHLKCLGVFVPGVYGL